MITFNDIIKVLPGLSVDQVGELKHELLQYEIDNADSICKNMLLKGSSLVKTARAYMHITGEPNAGECIRKARMLENELRLERLIGT